LPAAAIDDLATVFGFHSFSETAGGLTLFFARLVSALHELVLLGVKKILHYYSLKLQISQDKVSS